MRNGGCRVLLGHGSSGTGVSISECQVFAAGSAGTGRLAH
jgi:hypothetical protein